MSKVAVVVMSSYPVPDHRGVHLEPGTVADVELTDEVKAHVAEGRLLIVERQERPEEKPVTKPRAPESREAPKE